jgi:hypothetical protein
MVHHDVVRPLFITGLSRSGTSYLIRPVNTLPGVRLAYESDIIQSAYALYRKHDVLADRPAFDRYLARLRAIDRPAGRGVHNQSFLQSPEFYDAIYLRFREHRDFRKFIADLYRAGDESCEIWGDKCCTSQVPVVADLFPNARFIWIVRDVRAVVCSFRQHSGGDYYTTSLSWVNDAREAGLFGKERAAHTRVLRYEDLVARPQEHFERIASFLDREPPRRLSMVRKARTTSLDKWRGQLRPRQIRRIEEICFEEMRHYGYQPVYAHRKKNVGPLHFVLCLAEHAVRLLWKRPYRLRQVLRLRTLRRWVKVYVDWERDPDR